MVVKIARIRRAAIVFLAMAALLLPSTNAAFAKPLTLQGDSTDQGSTAVNGNSYTSPAFGYSVTWSRDWSVTDEVNQDNYNKLVLSDDISTVYFEGAGGSASMDDCLSTVSASYGKVDGVTKFKEVRNADDPLGDDNPDRVWGLYAFTYTGSSGDATDLNVYVDCRPIDPGNSFVAIEWLTTARDYDSETASFVDLMSGFAADGSTGSSDTGDTGNTGNSGNTGNTGNTDSVGQIENFVQISAQDVDDFWTREFPLISGGQAYTPPAGVVPFDKSVDTNGCGSADVGGGPFYCPADQTVYYDIPYAEEQIKNLGESAIAVAIAHEIGHHVQNLMQWKECQQTPCLDPTEMTSQEIELQADCFAGAWTADAETRGRLGGFDVETNIVQFAVFLGDPTGNTADPGAHGKGARRVYSFLTGYYEGVNACLKLSAASDPARNGGANANTNGGNTGNTGGDETPTPDTGNTGNTGGRKTPTPKPSGKKTPTPESGTTVNGNTGETIQMGDEYTIDLKNSSLKMSVTSTENVASIDAGDGFDADGTYLIVYFSVTLDADAAGPFPYDSFILTDADGTAYDYAAEATDALLKTSDTLPDGADQELDTGATYNLAIVYDVPKDASGFVFSTSNGDFPVELDK